MNHVTQHLTAYHHNEVSAELRVEVESHLSECARCRTQYTEIRFAANMASLLKASPAPDALWADLNKADSRRRSSTPTFAVAAATLLLVAALSAFLVTHLPSEEPKTLSASWAVENLRGAPRIGNEAMSPKGSAELRVGETIQTDAASQAEVRIADIGRLTVDPNTKIRLVVTKDSEHRIALDHGRIEALTWAPPRLFIVDTPTARAMDLGCMFTLEVQKDGSSLLHVTLGMVSLAERGRESFVLSHNYARTRTGFGPGTPFHEDSSEKFKAALDTIDFGPNSGNARQEQSRQLDVILSEAARNQAPTLWHLLSRVDEASREKVYDKLATFVPPPDGVTRSGILSLDKTMIRTWGEAVPELWWMIAR